MSDNTAIEDITLIKRKIYYYELKPKFNEYVSKRPDKNKFIELFSDIAELGFNKHDERYQKNGSVELFMQDVNFDDKRKMITGKLRAVRSDVFPELFNKSKDEAKGIEHEEDDGVLETTHFIISYGNKSKILAIENNYAGAKFHDFIIYCERLGEYFGSLKSMHYVMVTNDELTSFKQRMNMLSKMIVRVHKNNVNNIESIDSGLYTSLKNTVDMYNPEYVELTLKFKFKNIRGEQKIQKQMDSIMDKLIQDKEKLKYFDVFIVHAQDNIKNDYIQAFDLLIDKVYSEISVQKKKKYKTLVSADVIEKMKDELEYMHL